MITLLKWPPPDLQFRCGNESFTWTGAGPFDDWVETIASYGRANSLPEDQWSQQAVYTELARQLGSAAGDYFKAPRPLPGVDMSMPCSKVHTTPVPEHLLKTAQSLHPGRKWDAAAAAEVLGELSPSQWLKLLRTWKAQNPVKANMTEVAGPIWWYALHTLALNCEGLPGEPGTWVNHWHADYPCEKCRKHFNKCPFAKPTKWVDLFDYADAAHNWVTANK